MCGSLLVYLDKCFYRRKTCLRILSSLALPMSQSPNPATFHLIATSEVHAIVNFCLFHCSSQLLCKATRGLCEAQARSGIWLLTTLITPYSPPSTFPWSAHGTYLFLVACVPLSLQGSSLLIPVRAPMVPSPPP